MIYLIFSTLARLARAGGSADWALSLTLPASTLFTDWRQTCIVRKYLWYTFLIFHNLPSPALTWQNQMKRQKSKNDRDKSGCFIDSLDLTNSEQCDHLQLGPCCYCCYCYCCSGSHSDGSQTCRGLVTVALSLPVLLMASRGLDILDIPNVLDNAQLWLLLSKFRKRKLRYYHLFGRLSVAQGYLKFSFSIQSPFFLSSPQKDILLLHIMSSNSFFILLLLHKKISSSKYFPFPVLLIDNEYGRISVEISGHFELWLRIYATAICFFAFPLYFLLISQLICSTYYVDGVTVII